MIFVGALFISQRGLDTPDTLPYLEWFEDAPIGNNHVEQGYAYLCKLLYDLGLSFNSFLFLVAFIEMEVWVCCTKRLFPKANLNLLLALCLSFYGIYFWGCVLRASISITIAYIAFTYLLNCHKTKLSRLISFYILILIAFFFHSSSVIYLICPLFLIRWNKYIYWSIALCSILIAILLKSFGIGEFINLIISSSEDLDRFQNYTAREGNSSFPSLFWLISLALCIYVMYNYKSLITKENFKNQAQIFFINLYIAGFFFLTMTLNIPAGSRLGMMFTFFEFLIIYFIARNLKKVATRYILYSSYIGLRFSYMIYSFPLFLNY